MKKTIKFLLFLCLPLLLVACFVCGNNPVVAHALTEESSQEEYVSPSKNPNYNNLEYVIDSYDVEIVVGEDNVFFVTETITAYFNVSKHGIKRFIPYKNEVRRTDGSRNTYIAKIKNISVDEKFSKSTEQGNIVLTIGDENKTLVKESKTYVISYSFDVGKDMLKDKDEFYFNIIGTNWDTVIGNVTFNISMPKEFDASRLGFSSGSFGDTSSDRVSYTLNGNNIFGSLNGDLNARSGLTVRLELPEGYFATKATIFQYLYFIVPAIVLLCIILFWLGDKKGVVKTIEFYPPYDFNSLEMAFNYRGRVNNKDISSLIVYLASKGYIEIIDDSSKLKGIDRINMDRYIKLRKLKEYYGSNKFERKFMRGLFKDEDEITLNKVPSDFYKSVEWIKSNIALESKQIFKESKFQKIIISLLFAISMLGMFVIPMIDYRLLSVMSVVSSIFITIVYTVVMNNFIKLKRYFPVIAIMIIELLPIVFLLLIINSGIIFRYSTIYLVGLIFNLLLIMLYQVVYSLIENRNEKGKEVLGKILGFKEFLKTAEKSRLEALVNENPKYFYDILPYAYVLGVSHKWIDKFKVIDMPEVEWYVSSGSNLGDLTIYRINSCISNTVNSVSKTSTNQYINSSSGSSGGYSGGSSGGGFSGGGGGGGGGSSW